MTYQVLARKWRPKDFASLVGQAHVVKALTHALERQQLHHAYLLSGTRGVGKTTLARILTKALNCETGISATPCGQCQTCVEIDATRSVDYIEMDAASNRSVDEMSALLERAIYAPVAARFQVYMIDEAHMLTHHAFNAMLKTLEEPPPHLKFILATTDPKKIPVTVLSRCLQFNLKQMPAEQISAALEKILVAENVRFEPRAVHLLARAAHGSMRDALSLTDQAIAYAARDLSLAAIREMLGAVEQRYLVQLLDAVVERNGAAVLELADEMAAHSVSFAHALQDLASLLHQIAWSQYAPDSIPDAEVNGEEIRRFAGVLPPEEVQLYYQIVTIGRSELGLAPDEYAGFTMTLLRMLAFCAVDANDCRTPQTTSKTEARSASPARAALEVLNGVRSVDDQAAVQRQQDAERALKQDPFVKQLARDFGATLIPGSVQ
ncbi:DNA polymerase III, gamma and tau subunit [Candidatus Glomeribacter gigasporarum BEG34]|uniref:DNA polymerase III subunit gamma/tau n=1 Tax=Candidatus Glomeribacter gigasporarum BEG34 TaxID=1070319 RepID=G2J9W8_9BURK|nr:DNA polymerase III, gamma and tau subunit [Candidatus Glomeribacter gigasporarum BEG34]